jgi:hypothetical protein
MQVRADWLSNFWDGKYNIKDLKNNFEIVLNLFSLEISNIY